MSLHQIYHRPAAKYTNRQYYSFLKKFGSSTDATVVLMCLMHLVDMKELTIK